MDLIFPLIEKVWETSNPARLGESRIERLETQGDCVKT
jgi:hypothetical protein